MRLSEWLNQRGETQTEFAARPEIDVHPITVNKWATGLHLPRAASMAAIERVTGGAVRAGDFYPETQPEEPIPAPMPKIAA